MPRNKKLDGLNQANGAFSNLKEVEARLEAAKPAESKEMAQKQPSHGSFKQTHGAMIPSGPITSVAQLLGARTKVDGSPSSFDSLADYGGYLRSLSLGSLQRHALEEGEIVPIADRDRLIRRLESGWSASMSKAGRKVVDLPQSRTFTKEQTNTMEEVRRKLLHL